MANTHETLNALFEDIADSIRAKTGETADIVADTFPTAIDAIPDLASSTADATATASDMASGKTAYVNGEKVTGALPVVASGGKVTFSNASPVKDTKGIYLYATTGYNRITLVGSTIAIYSDPATYGDATAEDVASGKTFTSSAGIKVAGTLNVSGGSITFGTTNITSGKGTITLSTTQKENCFVATWYRSVSTAQAVTFFACTGSDDGFYVRAKPLYTTQIEYSLYSNVELKAERDGNTIDLKLANGSNNFVVTMSGVNYIVIDYD